jgi:hypothetical protein
MLGGDPVRDPLIDLSQRGGITSSLHSRGSGSSRSSNIAISLN